MKKRAFLFIILAGIFWGTSGLFVNALAPRGFSSLQMTATRGVVSLICFAAYSLLFDRRLFRIKPSELLLFVCSGLSLFGTAFCYYTSMQMTSVATAVVLMYTAPIFVTVFSVLFLGEKMTALKAVAITMMIAGCCFVSGIIGGLKFDLGGILVGLLSGISYSAYNIFTKVEMKKGSEPASAAMYNFVFMSILALSICQPAKMLGNVDSAGTVLLMIGIGVVTTVLPYLLYTIAMKDLPAGTATSLGVVEPLSATIFGMIFLAQTPNVFGFFGIALIVVAVFLLGRAEDGGADKHLKQDELHKIR